MAHAEADKRKQTSIRHVKCGVLGDGAVGKTDLLLTYATGICPEEYSPGCMDWRQEYAHVTKQVTGSDGQVAEMSFIDTCGQEEYERLRVLQCAQADVFLLCYDIANRISFVNIEQKWLECCRSYTEEKKPFVLVGLKMDLRSQAESRGEATSDFVTHEEGRQAAKKLKAAYFVECSARLKIKEGVPFERAVDATAGRKGDCRVM